MNLHGWESLKRLIGKRRRSSSRCLPKLLSSSKPFGESTDNDIELQPSSSTAEKESAPTTEGQGAGDKEWVSCPVCGRSIRGTDYNVNTHLDACLTGGTKRKLTQCTLLQFQFSKRTRTEPSFNYIKYDDKDNIPAEFNSIREYNDNPTLPKGSLGIQDGNTCTSDALESPLSDCGTSTEVPPPESVLDNCISHDVLDPCGSYVSTHINMGGLNECGIKDANPVVTFGTCIVGRRFHDNVDLQKGARITVVREPDNVKDRNAIKALYVDSCCVAMLGYLPRDLSKHLSPLIDNNYIECKLVCHKIVDSAEKKSDDSHNFGSLWENLLDAIENINTHPPKMAKYQKNFCLMIEEVIRHHSHLFTTEEKSLLGAFNSLSDNQKLFIRLYTRKGGIHRRALANMRNDRFVLEILNLICGPWFRVNNISYPEIRDTEKAIKELQSYIYTFDSSEDPFAFNMEEVLNLLNGSEMRQIISLVFPKKGTSCARRHELVDILLSGYANGACTLLPKMVLEQAGTCIRISSSADVLFWRVQRLFFLNGEQDLSAFLLVDLGMIKFPDYICNVHHKIFQYRADFLAYEEAIEVAQIMDESLEENDVDMVIRCIDIADSQINTNFTGRTQPFTSDMPPQFFSYFTASFVYTKVLSLGVSFFEHKHRYEDAIGLLKGLLGRITRDSRRGHWTSRLSVNLEHINRVNESLSVAEEGLLDPSVRAGSKMALQRRVLRLGKPPRRWRVPDYADSVKRKIKEVCINGKPLTNETASKNMYYGYNDELCGVEQLALQYYAAEGGWSGVHSESGIWMTIFGLLMWDVLFYDVPDVFRSRFQMAPLDLDTDDFYVTRKNVIECQLQMIQDGMAEEILVSSWESHVGTACRGVHWERHSLSDLRAAVACIGGRSLAYLCRHLAIDYRSWSSGMPDLILWRFHGDYGEGEAKLVEVKGPRDRLSEQQRAWLLTLMDCGFAAEVCKVRPLQK